MERLTFSDAGPADWPYLLCLWWRNVRATHGFVAEDYLRAIGAALPGVYLPAMERVRLAWLEVAPAEGDGSDHAPGAGEGHFPTGTVAVPRPSQGRLPAGFLGSVEQRVEMLFVEPGLRGRGIGTALLEDFGSRHPETLLDVNEQNTAARIFYARRGFEVVGRSPLDGASRIRSCICAVCGTGAPGQGKQPDTWPFDGLASLPSQQGGILSLLRRGHSGDVAAQKTETPGGTRRFGIVRENDNAVSLGKEISMRLSRGGRGGRSTAAPRRGPRRPGSGTCRHSLRRGS